MFYKLVLQEDKLLIHMELEFLDTLEVFKEYLGIHQENQEFHHHLDHNSEYLEGN